MTSVQVRILSGSAAGTRLRVEKDTVTFGRSPDCDVTIDQSFVSREHGRLTRGEKGWVLENHSPNGTLVAGKRVTRKPRPIAPGQTVAIGNEDVFEVISLGDAPAPAEGESDAPPGQEKQPMAGRTKLWIGIGAYMVLMLGLFVFFSTMSDGGEASDGLDRLPAMTEGEIRAAVSEQIRSTVPKQPPDSRLAREHANRALAYYNQRATNPQAWINALQQYRLALSYTPGHELPDIEHERRYIEVRDHLIDEITKRYYNAYNLLYNRDLERADEQFRELLRIYHAPGTPLYQQIQDHWDTTKAQLRRRD